MRAMLVRSAERTWTALAIAISLLFLAAMLIISFDRPVPVLGALFVVAAVIAVVRFPVGALLLFLFLEPFHFAIFFALNNRAGLSTGPLSYWKDALIAALFVRVIVERFWADRRLPLRNLGDNLLLFLIVAYIGIAALSPSRPTVLPALSRYVAGPLLLLSIRFLRPSRRELLLCAGAMLAAAAIMGGAAVYEYLGPKHGFVTWYGGPRPRIEGGYRSHSFLASSLILGFYLAGSTPFAVAVAAVRTRWRTLAILCAALSAAGLVCTVTRSGYLGGGVGVLVVLSLLPLNRAVRLSLVGLVVVAAGATSLYFVAAGNQTLLRPSSNEAHRFTLERDVELLVARPFGYGLGTSDRFSPGTRGGVGATESTYMSRALEGGIHLALLYVIALYVTMMRLRSARLRALRAGDAAGAALAAGGIGALLGVALAGLFLGVSEVVVELVLWGPPAIALAWPAGVGGSAEARASATSDRAAPDGLT